MHFQYFELLQSVLIVSGIATVLSILMVIADATIGNYGEKKLTINNDEEKIVEGGQPLLSALKSHDIFIPSACGGRGSCGLCKVAVNNGGGDYLPTELPWISNEEQQEKIRLSCQLKVKDDMSLTIPEELFNIKEFETEVTKLVDLTHDVKEVTLKLKEPAEISFKAGQFIQFETPEYDLTDEPVYRAYSIASAPSNKNNIQLEIKLVPHGICTTYVHKHLKVGDSITINGAYGDFYLRDTEREIIFMATGSGMAPIRSILLDMAEKGIDRKATYFFGCREHCDLFLLDEMAELEKKMPNFTFVPALSRPEEGKEWTGEVGRLNTVLKKHIPDGSNMEAYLCAGSRVIDSYKEVLREIGVPEEQIFYDDFG